MSAFSKKFSLLMVLLVFAAVLFAGCAKSETPSPSGGDKQNVSSEAPAPQLAKKDKLVALCGPVGGSGFSFLSVWAPIVNTELNTNISVQSRGGNAMTARLVDAGEGDFGLSTSGLCYEGMQGAEWTENKKLTNLRAVAVFQEYVLEAFGLAKTGIKKIEDLNGKRVSYNRKGTSTQAYLDQFMPFLGIKPANVSYVGPGQGVSLISDGRLDAQFTMGSNPHSRAQELEANHKIFVIGMGKENVKKILEKWPYLSPYTIKAKDYKSLDHDEYTVSDPLLLITNKDLPEDTVYNVLKTTFEKKKDLEKGFEPFKDASIENITKSSIPLHPGAVRFYKEKGINLPDKLIPPK